VQYVKADESIRNLVGNYRGGELILSPSFQRGYVWSAKQASKLIESILMSIPLPSIYLYELMGDSDKTVREVIDGKQRLTTIIHFVLEKSPWNNGKKFRLTSKYPDLNGKTFNELTVEQKKKIYGTKLRTIEIPSSIDPEMKYTLFERVNVGSVSLNPQEIRNCISRGHLNNWLNDMAESNTCVRLMGNVEKNKRMERQDALLRMCLIQSEWNGRDEIPHLTKTRLDKFMRRHTVIEDKDMEPMFKSVSTALKKALTIFGEDAFKSPKGFDSRSLVAVVSWLMNHEDLVTTNGLGDKLKESLDIAKSDLDFQSASTRTKAGAILHYLDECISERAIRRDPIRRYSRTFAQKLFSESTDKACAICSNQIHSFDDCDVDHRIPWALGGKTSADNAQLTHSRCNRQKGMQVEYNG